MAERSGIRINVEPITAHELFMEGEPPVMEGMYHARRRLVRPTMMGYIYPMETPEGENRDAQTIRVGK